MPAAKRPIELVDELREPADDGLFGPDSVTWKVMASAATSVGTATAVLAQMLHPRVVRLIGQASTFERNPELRGRLTAQYATTITYGDTASAENAGAMLRRLHGRMKATDVETGEEYDANEPDLLMWVHATIPWALMRAYDRWGPELTLAEKDRFVREQRTAARLVGLDPETAPGSFAELEAYIEGMLPRLAYTTDAGRIRGILVPRKVPRSLSDVVSRIAVLGAVDLLPAEMRQLYGYWWTPLHRALIGVASNGLVQTAVKKTPYEKMLPELRDQAATHAFGAKALRINRDLRRETSRQAPATSEDPTAD